MRRIFFDEKQQMELLQKGYVKVPFLSASEVTSLLELLEQLHPNNSFDIQKDEDSKPGFYYSVMNADIEYKRKATESIQKVFAPHIDRLLDGYKILTSSFFVKPPQGGFLDAHQHFPLSTNINDISVIIWCPLIDVDETNGTLQVVEGSHKIVPGVVAYCYPQFFKDYPEKIRKCSKPLSLKAGEAIIFDNNLIHWSNENTSAKYRFTAQIMAIPAEIQPVFYYSDKNCTDKFEVFEINSEFFIKQILLELLEKRPENLKSLGFIKNENQTISEENFTEMLKQGSWMLPKIHFIKEEKKQKMNLLAKIKTMFR